MAKRVAQPVHVVPAVGQRITVEITPKMYEIVKAARIALDAPCKPEPARSEDLQRWRHRSMYDLWYLLKKLDLVHDDDGVA